MVHVHVRSYTYRLVVRWSCAVITDSKIQHRHNLRAATLERILPTVIRAQFNNEGIKLRTSTIPFCCFWGCWRWYQWSPSHGRWNRTPLTCNDHICAHDRLSHPLLTTSYIYPHAITFWQYFVATSWHYPRDLTMYMHSARPTLPMSGGYFYCAWRAIKK